MATLGNSRNLHKSRWPPEPIWKINFPATYLRMMYNTSFHGVLCMQNPFLMLIFKCQDKVMSKSRWSFSANL